MTTITLHARFQTSEYDEGDGPGQLFDNDPREGTYRAYRSSLRLLRSQSKTHPQMDWRKAKLKLRPELQRIAQNYWNDLDHDSRKTSADIKEETAKLITPLSRIVEFLEACPPSVFRGLNAEARRAQRVSPTMSDAFQLALAANQALLEVCHTFQGPKHRKQKATRFANACRDLVILWQNLSQSKFNRNVKTGKAADRDIAQGIKREFLTPDARFVFASLYEIGNHWVKVSQVEEALKQLFRAGGR